MYKTVLPLASIAALTITSLFFACQSNKSKKEPNPTPETHATAQIFNVDLESDLREYERLNLDESHPNLLDPRNAKEKHDTIIASWTALHQGIGAFLSEKDFQWDIEDSSVQIIHKIYFHPSGAIKTHAFKVMNPEVSRQKQDEFAELLAQFAMDNPINFSGQKPFAQCGKTRYAGY